MGACRRMSSRASLVGLGAGWQMTINTLTALAAEVQKAGDRAGAEEIVGVVYSIADLGATMLRERRASRQQVQPVDMSRDKGLSGVAAAG